MQRRNTIQKELILNTVRNLRGHVTADEVYEEIVKDYPSVGKGTVYRNLNILAEEAEIRKVEIPDGPDRFDFTTKDHYHVICVKCKNVFDVDMEVIPDLENQIVDTHGIQFLKHDIVFKGICSDCQNKNENGGM